MLCNLLQRQDRGSGSVSILCFLSLSSDSSALLARWQPHSAFSLLSNARSLCSSLTPLCLQALWVVSSIWIVSPVHLCRKPGSSFAFSGWQSVYPWLRSWTSNLPPKSVSWQRASLESFSLVFREAEAHEHWPRWSSNDEYSHPQTRQEPTGLILSRCVLLGASSVSACVCLHIYAQQFVCSKLHHSPHPDILLFDKAVFDDGISVYLRVYLCVCLLAWLTHIDEPRQLW